MGFITGLYIRGCLTIYQLVIWISQPSIDIHRMCSHIFPWFWWFSKVFPICSYDFLFGGLEHVLFFRILGIVTPTDYIYFFFQRGWNHQPVFHLLMGFPIAMFEDPVLRGALPPSPRLGCYGFGTPACVDENLMPQLLNCNWVLKWWYHTGWPPPVTLW